MESLGVQKKTVSSLLVDFYGFLYTILLKIYKTNLKKV